MMEKAGIELSSTDVGENCAGSFHSGIVIDNRSNRNEVGSQYRGPLPTVQFGEALDSGVGPICSFSFAPDHRKTLHDEDRVLQFALTWLDTLSITPYLSFAQNSSSRMLSTDDRGAFGLHSEILSPI